MLMYDKFDFSILESEDFKEDSVREELILPLIKALGYSATGDNRIIRSKNLVHPFLSIGSKRRQVSIIPDYLFKTKDEFHWVLDAKAPYENILKGKNVEQAYSYAIHPEVRSRLFALCNGREFVLFDIKRPKPILHFPLPKIENYWETLARLLHPEYKGHPELVDYLPDYGLHLRRLGVKPGFIFIAPFVHSNFISRKSKNTFTTSTAIDLDGIKYLASFDFGNKQYKMLLNKFDKKISKKVKKALDNQPYYFYLDNSEFTFGLAAKLTAKLENNNEEFFVPFYVTEFYEYSNEKP